MAGDRPVSMRVSDDLGLLLPSDRTVLLGSVLGKGAMSHG
jgi:hypothetical protein